MKAIKVSDSIITREMRRSIDRNADVMSVYLAVEPMFGVPLSESTYRSQGVFVVQVEKRDYPELWGRMKDAGNDALMEEICGFLNDALQVVEDFEYYEEHPATRTAIQETDPETSELVIWYKDEDEAAFQEAQKRTGIKPTEVIQPNPYAEQKEALERAFPIVEAEELIQHLRGIKGSNPLHTMGV